MLYHFIRWMIRRSWRGTGMYTPIVNDAGDQLHARRYCPLWPDKPWGKNWFNVVLNRWVMSDNDGYLHDHPRWSITIVLRGTGWEHTPWEKKRLYPGKIIIRSRKYIHRIEVDRPGKFWTLFIVGKWKHEQNLYALKESGNNERKR